MFKPQIFAKKYVLLEKIATGGMAEVFKSKSYGVEGFEKLVVIKKILPHLSKNARFVSMFINEAKIAVSLNHGNIAQVFHLGKEGEDYYITMEYVHGRDLMQLIKACRQNKRSIPIQIALFIASEMARGLDYAHRKQDVAGQSLQIVHRDISPHNIVLSFEGEVKIVDFGIAKIVSQIEETQHKGRWGGKVAYMSPEQVDGLAMDARSDLFSLGLVLYEILTGQKAYQGNALSEKIEHVKRVEIQPIRSVRSDIPEEVERIIKKLLSRYPEQRYQTAGDLYEAITDYMFASGGVVTSRSLRNLLRDIFQADLEKELQVSGLNAVVGSLEKLEKNELSQVPESEDSLLFREKTDAENTLFPKDENTPTFTPVAYFPIAQEDQIHIKDVVLLTIYPKKLNDMIATYKPYEYIQIRNSIAEQIQKVVNRYGGMLENWHHDSLDVFWGMDQTSVNAHQVILCANDIKKILANLESRKGFELDTRMSINSGQVLVWKTDDGLFYSGIGHGISNTLLYNSCVIHNIPNKSIFVSATVYESVKDVFDWIPVKTNSAQNTIIEIYELAGTKEKHKSQSKSSKKPSQKEQEKQIGRWYTRKSELETLSLALKSVAERQAMVLGINGIAGIGKTRFVSEIARLIRNKNIGWTIGHCLYHEREKPLSVFRNMLSGKLNISKEENQDVLNERLKSLLELGLYPSDLNFVKDLFASSKSLDPRSSMKEGVEFSEGFFHAMRRLVCGLTNDRPVIFIIENAQWADSLSWKLIKDLMDVIKNLPILIVLTYQKTYCLDKDLPIPSKEILLAPLTMDNVAQMIRSILDIESFPETFLFELYEQTKGNPLHLEQLINVLHEKGDFVIENRTLLYKRDTTNNIIPQTLQELVELRVASVSLESRKLLHLISVLGRQANLNVIEKLQAPLDVSTYLNELSTRNLIRTDNEKASFPNHVTWEVAYNGIDPRVLKTYHALIGETYESLYKKQDIAQNSEDLFHHFESAGILEKAAKYAVMSAEHYERKDLRHKSVDFYLKAISILQDMDESEDNLREMALLSLRAGCLQLFIGDREGAEVVLEKGLDIAGDLEDIEMEARFLMNMGRLRANHGDKFLAQSYLEHALELSDSLSSMDLSCNVLDILGTFYLEIGEISAAGTAFDKGLSLAKWLDNPLAMAHLLRGKGSYLNTIGEFDEALERFQHALSLSEEALDKILSGRILNNIGNTYNFMASYEDAMQAYRRSGELHKAVGYMQGAIVNMHNIGDLYFRQTKYSKAYAYFLESYNMATEYRWLLGQSTNMIYMGYIEAIKGDADTGLKRLHEGIDIASKCGNLQYVATAYWLEGLYYESQKRPQIARGLLKKGLEIATTLNHRQLEEEICKALGDT